MSPTQIQVLAFTFLLAAAIVLPMVVIAYRKKAKKRELRIQRELRALEREKQQRLAEEEANRQKVAAEARKDAVALFNKLEDRFREIRERVYASTPCPKCASGLVLIVDLDMDIGVLTGRCAKCGHERRIHALSRSDFLRASSELIHITHAYRTVQRLVPEYSGLAVSFPEADSRTK